MLFKIKHFVAFLVHYLSMFKDLKGFFMTLLNYNSTISWRDIICLLYCDEKDEECVFFLNI